MAGGVEAEPFRLQPPGARFPHFEKCPREGGEKRHALCRRAEEIEHL